MNVDNSHFTSLQPIRQRDLAWGQFINVYSCFNLDQTIRKCKYTWLHIRGNNTFVRRLLIIKRLVYIWKLECNEHELWTVVADWTEAAYERQFESDPVKRSSGGESVNGAHHLIQLLFVVDWHQMTSIVDTGVLKSTEKRRKYPSVTLHHHHLLSAVWCLFSSPLRPWSSDVVWRRRPSDSGPDPAGTSLLSPPSDTLRPDICSDSTQKELLWQKKEELSVLRPCFLCRTQFVWFLHVAQSDMNIRTTRRTTVTAAGHMAHSVNERWCSICCEIESRVKYELYY